jgi:glycosyltransferase involved in cell wall biosynthesis
VLLVSQCFYPEIGSAGNRMKNIFQLLEGEGFNVKVLTSEPTYPNKKLYQDKKFWDDEALNKVESIHRILIKNRKYSRSIFNRLIYYLEMAFKMFFYIMKDKEKHDVVFVSSPPIFVGFVGLYAKVRYKSKLIVDIRDLWPESLKGVGVFNYKIVLKMFSYFEKHLYKKADHIIVNSFEFKDHIIKNANIDPQKIGFIPNASRIDEIPNVDHQETDDFKVIYTGNLGLAQDIDILKELASHLHEHKIGLSIVGYGMKKNELKEFVKEHKLKNVEFYSPVTRKEVFQIKLKHDVGFVSLNDKKVFETVLPGKIVDYMTCQLPIVASVSGYSKEVIEKENVGFVSENRDINEIVKYILYLRKNPKTRQRMSSNSAQFIKKNFIWEHNISELINRIEDIENENVVITELKTSSCKVD